MSEHTPTPWEYVALKGGWDGVRSESGIEICALHFNNPANARRIVHCVNHFDEVVEALERIMKATPHSMCADAEAWAKAEAVLEKVKK